MIIAIFKARLYFEFFLLLLLFVFHIWCDKSIVSIHYRASNDALTVPIIYLPTFYHLPPPLHVPITEVQILVEQKIRIRDIYWEKCLSSCE
jgi:hypothetical protein